MHRLFVACVPPPGIRQILLDMMGSVDAARWQDDDQLHLTMRYIGEVERPTAERIAEQLTTFRGQAFTVALNGVGYFEKRGRAHTLWAGISPTDAATALHGRLDRALVKLGLPPEARAYRPHITIARLSQPTDALAPFLQAHGDLASPPFALDSFSLFESLPSAGGRVYRPVLTVPLS